LNMNPVLERESPGRMRARANPQEEGQLGITSPETVARRGRNVKPLSKRKWLEYVCLPYAVQKAPPIRARGAPRESGLTVVDFRVARNILAATRWACIGRPRNEQANHARTAAQKKAGPKRGTWKGKEAYFHERAEWEEHHWPKEFIAWLPVVDVEWGIASKSKANRAAIDAGIERLREPVKLRQPVTVNKEWFNELPPVLLAHGWDDDDRLYVEVHPWWMPRHSFNEVKGALPDRAVACALRLFIAGAELESDTTIETAKLCRLVGIKKRRPALMRRDLLRAAKHVNKYLEEHIKLEFYGDRVAI
jgi:hypothetical protein